VRKFILTASVTLAATAAVTALAAQPPAYLGAWVISRSQPAPWAAPGEPPVQSDIERLVGKRVVFDKDRIAAPEPLACAGPHYEIVSYTSDLLFQGNLTEPDKQAMDLGYRLPQIMTLETGCAGPIEFHFLNGNTAMFALNDRLYRLERTRR